MRLPPEQGLGETMLARERQRAVHEGTNARKALEIAVDDRFAFIPGQPQATGDSPGRASVEDREIDRLGLVAGVAIDPAEQLLGGDRVDVRAGVERLLQLRNV